MADKDKKKSGFFGGFTSVKDMFDGGGAGASGDTFQGGGLISAVGNAARVAPRGYHDRNSGGGSSSNASQSATPQRTVSNRGVLDFFDGGGLGARGSSFQGLPISTIFNTLGMRPQGSQVANPQQQVGLRDFYDGGGYGQSGQSFQGAGGYSMLANALGVRPAGYEDRMAAVRPQMRQDYSELVPVPEDRMELGARPYQIQENADMTLGANPYEIMPTELSIGSAPDVEVSPLDPLGNGVEIDQASLVEFAKSLGPAGEGMGIIDLVNAYRLSQQNPY